MQWKNFKILLLESMASGFGNLIVGDVKQSIYVGGTATGPS